MVENYQTVETDVLVIGAGGVGLRAAIEADRNHTRVIIVDKGIAAKSGCTPCTSAPRARRISGPQLDFKLILQAGCYLADQDLLWNVCSEAPELLKELATWTTTPRETFTDSINREVVKHPSIQVLNYVMITKLLTQGGRVVGATGLDIVNGEFVLFKAKAVILATGGYGELYEYAEAIPQNIRTGVTGDGQALAYNAGCELCNMEMMTFELQGLYSRNKWLDMRYGILSMSFGTIHTAGPFFDKDGKLVLSTEEIQALPIGCLKPQGFPDQRTSFNPNLIVRFMQETQKHGPLYCNVFKTLEHDKRELSTLTFRDSDEMLNMGELVHDEAFREEASKIHIVPSARIGQGSPKVNAKCETSIPGLYGAGESGSGNIYGAYRIAGFIWSLVVQGKWVGENAAAYAKTVTQGDIPLDEVTQEWNRLLGFLQAKANPITPQDAKKKIRQITGEHLYVYRNENGLKQALHEIDELRNNDLPRIQAVNIRRYNNDWVDAIEAQNMLDVAEMMARSSLFRTESRGCFNREDYPQIDNEHWLYHTLLKKENDQMVLSKGSIVMTKYKPPTVEECLKGGEPTPL